MSSLIDLAAVRAAREDVVTDPGHVACACGSEWFELSYRLGPGAIMLNNDNRIVGYSGEITCMECGKAR